MTKLLLYYVFPIIAVMIFIPLIWHYQINALNADITVLRADRDYWRVAAHNPKLTCRMFGGEYKVNGFFYDFGTGKYSESYTCIDQEMEGIKK